MARTFPRNYRTVRRKGGNEDGGQKVDVKSMGRRKGLQYHHRTAGL